MFFPLMALPLQLEGLFKGKYHVLIAVTSSQAQNRGAPPPGSCQALLRSSLPSGSSLRALQLEAGKREASRASMRDQRFDCLWSERHTGFERVLSSQHTFQTC